MSRLGCADEEADGERSDRELSPTPILMPKLGIPGVLDRWRGSVVAPPKLLAIGNWLGILQSSTFSCRFAIFDLCFCSFKSGG